jgi:hypothetical protein
VARHGYLREYDEAPDRSDNRGEDWGESNRAFMLDRDRGRSENRDFSGGSRDERSSLRPDDDRGWRGPGVDERRGSGAYGRSYSESQGDVSSSGREQGGFGDRGDWERSPRNFSSRQDDHYLSWRDRQMRALDNDYADYCREREQQFHSDFENWRRSRQQGKEVPVGEAAELELTQERVLEGEGNTPSPVSEATLGTNNSENTSPGRR